MAFVVEDGTGSSNANSYASVSDFREYWADRGVSYSSKTDAEVQYSLIKATQYIDRNYRFIGAKQTEMQSLQWPRWYAYSPEGYIYSGIPNDLIFAVCEATAIDIAGTSLFSSTESGITEKTENVGPVETTYKYNGEQTKRTVYQAIQIYVKFLVRGKVNKVRRY